MGDQKAYKYRVFSLEAVLGVFRYSIREDSYLSDDLETQAILESVASGYRWVRSDGENAIFEIDIVAPSSRMTRG